MMSDTEHLFVYLLATCLSLEIVHSTLSLIFLKNPYNISLGNDFLTWYQSTGNKQDSIKRESFFTAKETVNERISHPTGWEEIFASHISDMRCISKMCKELLQLNSMKTNNLIKKDNL